MTDIDPEDERVVVERDGVRVEKTFEPEDFPVPAIAFVIRSDRDESVSVRLVDGVPDDVSAEDIGFHPAYGADFWSVDGETIVFEREFDPDEEFTTVYGLRASDTDDPGRFLGEPDLASVDPPSPGDAGDVVRDVIDEDASAGSSESGPDTIEVPDLDDVDDTDGSDDDETVEPLDLSDPSDDDVEAAITAVEDDEAGDEPAVDEASEAAVEDDEEATDAEGHGEPAPGEPVAGPDAEAESGSESGAESGSESGAESEADAQTGVSVPRLGEGATEPAVRAVSDEPGAGGGPTEADAESGTERAGSADGDDDRPAGTDAVIAAMAEEVRAGRVDDEDLSVLREALVESGSREARIQRLQSEVADLAAYRDALERFLDDAGHAEELLALTDDVDHLDRRVSALEGDVDDVRERAVAAERRAEVVADDVASVADDVDERLAEVRDSVDRTLADIRAEVEELDAVFSELSALESRVEDIEAQFDALRADLEDLAEMRDQLSSVFAGVEASGSVDGTDGGSEGGNDGGSEGGSDDGNG